MRSIDQTTGAAFKEVPPYGENNHRLKNLWKWWTKGERAQYKVDNLDYNEESLKIRIEQLKICYNYGKSPL